MFLSNLREAGGIPAAGGRIASGVLFRCAAPHQIDQRLTDWVAETQLSRIFDLRSTQETSYLPGFPASIAGAARTHLPLLEGAVGQLSTLEEIYEPLVALHGSTWAALAAGISEPGASLVHCTAGKDRTGVGVALVLLAVGAEKDAVLEDYSASTAALSGHWLSVMTRQMQEHGVQLTEAMRTLLVGTSVADLEQALAVAERSGSIADYLLSHGLTRAQLETLGEKLVAS
ncbi:tyrosine-protein phosphatase [Glutamicibacter sp. NPDC087344]|uniref:tyrosine-protein phosphatase n=1 Tax=Glutamicibacter sp. NPDC087344 TaxID=3363994 RepID=UPI00381FC288